MGKKSVYGLFLLIVFSAVLAIALCLAFNPIVDSQNSNVLSAGLLSATNGNCPAEVKITADEAGKIAILLAEQYAKENNRAITNTAEPSLINDDRPEWYIEVEFEAITGRGLNQIYGYHIAVWADTGEIWYQGPLSIYVSFTSFDDVKITADEAVKIAMPLAEQYAKENGNRTITPMVEALLSDRQKYNPDSRPVWSINVNFEYISLEVYQELGLPYWIDGYYIEVWADTGEIRDHHVQGYY